MLKFLVDEDMPRSTTKTLRGMGFETFDVRRGDLIATYSDSLITPWYKLDSLAEFTGLFEISWEHHFLK